jgi:hypothetical protein
MSPIDENCINPNILLVDGSITLREAHAKLQNLGGGKSSLWYLVITLPGNKHGVLSYREIENLSKTRVESLGSSLDGLAEVRNHPYRSIEIDEVGIGEAKMLAEEDVAIGNQKLLVVLKEGKPYGLFEVVELGAVKKEPPVPQEWAPKKEQQRFLQERTFIEKAGKLVEENRVFLKGRPTHIRVRIGPADEKWLALGNPFPDEKLPPNKKDWTLDVALTEPNHLHNALRNKIIYPITGASPECDFAFIPSDNQFFEGRVTVLHRGRVLQTGILKGRVVENEGEILAGDTIAFSEIAQVRYDTTSLDTRRKFDLAIVENHSEDGTHRAQGVTDENAWLVDLSTCTPFIDEINATLSEAAHTTADFNGDLHSDYGSETMRALARSGYFLHKEIITNFKGDRQKMAEAEYLQLINTRIDSLVPFEFIYDFSFPNNTATTCSNWKEALTEQKPPISECKVNNCRKKAREMVECDFVCPLGFWGLSKVIERQIPEQSLEPRVQVRPEPYPDHETISLYGPVLIGAHKNINPALKEKPLVLDRIIQACKAQFGEPATEVPTWKEWTGQVKSLKPRVLILLSHTEGSGSTVSLEIGGEALKCGQMNWHYVKPEDNDLYKPLVALIGCDTTGSGMRYGGAVSQFHSEGAAIVIGTIAEVFGQHAVRVAEMLVNRLKQGSPNNRRIGEVMQALKREALCEGLLMGLCLVAFGDADWILE